jgi:phytanoyl-CoA dioxygenase PhyH
MTSSGSTPESQALDLAAFNRNGFLLIKNVFSAGEIADLRQRMGALKARSLRQGCIVRSAGKPKALYIVGDLPGKDELADFRYLVFDRRVLGYARQILGPKLVYFGDSNTQFGEADRGFHKDNVDRTISGPDWKNPYTVIRLGLYLEDHTLHSGGLKVRVGSHQYVSHHRGQALNIPSEPGDLVIWYLRTTHSGNNVRLTFWPSLCLHPRIEMRIPESWRLAEAEERKSLFFTLGAPSEHVDRYIQYQIRRGDYHDHWKWCGWNRNLIALAEQSEVEFRRPVPEYGVLNPGYDPC